MPWGMGGLRLLAVQLQRGAARQFQIHAEDLDLLLTIQDKRIGKRYLVQSQLAGSALNRLGNPVVSYSPVRGSRDLVAARDTWQAGGRMKYGKSPRSGRGRQPRNA